MTRMDRREAHAMTVHAITSVLLAMAAFTTPALAQASGEAKQAPPPGGRPKPFALSPRETFTLANGLKVSLVPYGAIPVVAVSARVDFGNANESADQVWLADLLCALMKEGAGGLNGVQLAEEAARMGGQLSVGAGVDSSQVGIQVLSEFGADAVRLVANVIRHPTLPAAEVERLRADLLRRLAVDLSQPQPLADQAFATALYGDHPYGRTYPTEAMLKRYALADVKAFYAANVGARRTRLYVVGRFDASIKDAIRTAYESWAAGPAPVHDPPKPDARRQMTLIDRPGAEQSTVRLGLPVAADPSHPDYIPLSVADMIVGGAFGSRITANIREQKGYTYSPGSALATHYHTASWEEDADVNTKDTAPAIREIFSEIDRMRKEPPSAEELKGIQNLLCGVFVLRNTSHFGIINQLAFADLQGLGDDYPNRYVERVNAVTAADVQRVSEAYLDPKKMSLVVVGDKAKVGESLKQFQQ
jgi:zinc protease